MLSFTDKELRKALPAAPGRVDLTDPKTPGLFLRGNRGKATWTLRRTINGEPVRVVLGTFPSVGVTKAREAALAITATVISGDPVVPLRGRAGKVTGPTVESVLTDWQLAHGHLRRTDHRLAALKRAFKSLLSKDAMTLDTADYLKATDRLTTGAATKARRDMRAVLGWAAERKLAPEGVLRNVRIPRGKSRSHTPSMTEMRIAYELLDQVDQPSVGILRLICLTGFRVGEAMRLEWSWIKNGICTIPAKVAKDGKEHRHPLSKAALELINEQPHRGDRVFTHPDGRPITSLQQAKDDWDALIAATGQVRRFTLHDIRRAWGSGCCELGHNPLVVSLSLSHSPSKVLGSVDSIYIRSEMMEDRRLMTEKWAEVILRPVPVAIAAE